MVVMNNAGIVSFAAVRHKEQTLNFGWFIQEINRVLTRTGNKHD